MITGSLKLDSPSLHSKLKRLFTNEEILTLEASYNEICKSPFILSENNWREVGVNFNPKPARILEILIECGANSYQLLQRCLRTIPNQEAKIETPPEICLALILDSVRHLSYVENPKPVYHQLKLESSLIVKDFPELLSSYPKLIEKVESAFRLYRKFS